MQKHIKNQCKNWYRQNHEIHRNSTFRKCKTKQIRRKGHRISRFRKVRARTEIHRKYTKNGCKTHPKIDTKTDEKQGVKTICVEGGARGGISLFPGISRDFPGFPRISQDFPGFTGISGSSSCHLRAHTRGTSGRSYFIRSA